MKKLQTVVLALLLLVGAYSSVRALWPDPEADIGVLRMLKSGLVAFSAYINSNGHYDIQENTNLNSVLLRLNATDGSLLIRNRTSAQLKLLAPNAANELIVNSSVPAVCISTGTGGGAWVMMFSTNTAANSGTGSLNACY